MNRQQYDQYCQLGLMLATAAATARKDRRAHEFSEKKALAVVDARYAAQIREIEQARTLAVGNRPVLVEQAFAVEKEAMAKASQVLALLVQACAEGRASGEAWPDPPLPPGVTISPKHELEILHPEMVPASCMSPNESLIKQALKKGPVPGVDQRLTVTLTVQMLESEFLKFEPNH